VNLADNQFAVAEQFDLRGAGGFGGLQAADNAVVFGDIIGGLVEEKCLAANGVAGGVFENISGCGRAGVSATASIGIDCHLCHGRPLLYCDGLFA